MYVLLHSINGALGGESSPNVRLQKLSFFAGVSPQGQWLWWGYPDLWYCMMMSEDDWEGTFHGEQGQTIWWYSCGFIMGISIRIHNSYYFIKGQQLICYHYDSLSPNVHKPEAPWCWNISLQNWLVYRVNVGKYIQSMEHLGTQSVMIYSQLRLQLLHVYHLMSTPD